MWGDPIKRSLCPDLLGDIIPGWCTAIMPDIICHSVYDPKECSTMGDDWQSPHSVQRSQIHLCLNKRTSILNEALPDSNLSQLDDPRVSRDFKHTHFPCHTANHGNTFSEEKPFQRLYSCLHPRTDWKRKAWVHSSPLRGCSMAPNSP